LRGASIAGSLRVLGAALTFGLTVALGRILGAEATGIYFLAFTIATAVATVGRAGLDNAVLRFVAAHASVDKWLLVRRGYREVLAVGAIGSGLIAAALYLASDFLAGSVFSDSALALPLRIMAIAVVPLSLAMLVSKALLGLARVRDSTLVFQILPQGIALGGTLLLAQQWGVDGAAVASVIAVGVAATYGGISWSRALAGRPRGPGFQDAPSPIRELLKSGRPLLIGDVLYMAMQMSPTLMLGVWAGTADVSRYAVAWRTAMLVSFAPLAISTIVQPKFAELYARGDMQALAATTHRAVWLMVACSAPVLLIFVAMPERILSIFGSDFPDGAAILQILAVGQFINIALGSVGILLVMSGQEKQFRNVLVVSVCVALLLNVALIPAYGAIGAAIAEASALLVLNVLFGYAIWRRHGILMFSRRLHERRSGRDA
jgi:O-antigen/teichoic acid export membrane protein